MEQNQQQDNNNNNNNNMMSSGKGGVGNNYNMCSSRQSSTRWTPTTDQIRILKELYYNNGVRSPSAEQIQRISARLRQYGKIEGKNVFYWFQNHKARERQKKRFISEIAPPNHHSFQRSPAAPNSSTAPPFHHTNINITTTNIISHGVGNACASSSSTASPGVFAGFGPYGGGGGPVTMEKSFRECSLSAGGSNLGWAGVDPYATHLYSSSNQHEIRRNLMIETVEEEHEDELDDDIDEAPEIETLPLFPLHNEDMNNACFFNMKPSSDNGYYATGWYRPDQYDGYGRSRASLELTLSYNGRSHE